ncbi:Inhibitor of growth protein 1 [Cytospora mali]|uniref:Chromatin modification-related protein n=1 Tax=Cytospora mali TaxID=578113 RepID=A0A194VN44_CYTMA|nr:Inhibitor of growth protein 1 [Valsa mali]
MSTVGAGGADVDEEEHLSPRPQSLSMPEAIETLGSISNGRIGSFDGRADPDAQATVTDFLEFTEHLPADMIRSLTLIGTLDQDYVDASHKLHELTKLWGQLPTLTQEEKPRPAQLRADISDEINHVLTSRVYSHAEAVRMAENVNRHLNRLKLIHAKLRMMLDNYPAEDEQRSPVVTNKSPHMIRGTKRQAGGGEKGRRPRVPRITVPGEVLAPYDVGYDTYSGDSDSSEDEEDDEVVAPRRTPAARAGSQKPRGGRKPIDKAPKTPKSKIPKTSSQQPVTGVAGTPAGMPSATEPLNPPPENAVAGSDDAPWLRLTQWELSKLRKRMKKNAAWVPSETMIHKELKTLGRGYEGWVSAKKKAEEEGRPFEYSSLPQSVVDDATGSEKLPTGAIKKDRMSDIAAKEAEESARRFALVARNFQVSFQQSQNSEQAPAKAPSKRQQRKRKRDSVTEADGEKPDPASLKRSKTETPVPIPQHINIPRSQQTPGPPPQLTPGGTQIPQSTTPVPIPMPPGQDQSTTTSGTKSSATSPAPSGDATTTTTTVPTKAPAEDVPPSSPKKSTTPILPPVRETRAREAKNLAAREKAAAQPPVKTSASRAATPGVATPGPETSSRRPSSRGQQQGADHPQHHGLAADRPRRASTARNTPAPEQMTARQPSKRTKRPAPGIISRTNSGGNSAITKRKAAPKKSKRGAGAGRKREDARGQVAEAEAEVEVDEDGNVIDPNEEKYCFCNRVSYGTMVLCENESCPYEWFHIECLGLKTEKNLPKLWYCPECKDGREGGRRATKR